MEQFWNWNGSFLSCPLIQCLLNSVIFPWVKFFEQTANTNFRNFCWVDVEDTRAGWGWTDYPCNVIIMSGERSHPYICPHWGLECTAGRGESSFVELAEFWYQPGQLDLSLWTNKSNLKSSRSLLPKSSLLTLLCLSIIASVIYSEFIGAWQES